MECNKEEAIRSKEIAEKKMESKDFVGARKFASRAQRLYPDLKDIPQMILVCDVHCAAENKINGGEKDWYAILQLGPTVDEAAIRKQYRRLALLLHPDKNQFAGAADAFKIIGEAQVVLVDHQKRMAYDSRYRASRRPQPSNLASQSGSRQSNARAHPWFQNSFTGNTASKFMDNQSPQQKDQTEPAADANQPTFWTVCPFCATAFQYYKEQVNKFLTCRSCNKKFTGYEVNIPASSAGSPSSPATFSRKAGSVRKAHPSTVPKSTSKRCSSRTTNPGNTIFEKVKIDPPQGTVFTSNAGKKSVRQEDIQKPNVGNGRNRKKKINSAESSESCESLSSTDSGEDSVIGEDPDDQLEQNSAYHTEQNLRRSSRSRQQVSYDEYLSDDELGKPSKKSKSSEEVNLDADTSDQDAVGNNTFAGDYVVPDPDFYNFDTEKSLDKFQVGQIWALYCDEDALPKYYGIITKIDSPPHFGLHMSWLSGLKSKEIIQWKDKCMPVSCGTFKVARRKSQKYDNASPFSHQIRVQPSEEKDLYSILPQKGDIWALYKGWNESLTISDLELCEYEIVEILETNKSASVSVLLLESVKDYKSVFKPQTGGESPLTMQIPWEELFRFSHQIPAVRLSEEKEGSLRGFWELDTAALPVYFFF